MGWGVAEGEYTHLLRATKPPRDGARIARRAAAALQPDILVLAPAQQRMHRAHSPALGVVRHLPAVLQGVRLLPQQDRPECRTSDGVCLRL